LIFAQGATAGAVVSAMTAAQSDDFLTQPQAITAAEQLLDQFDQVNDWADNNFRELGVVDPGAGYEQLRSAVSLAAGALVKLALNLKQERRITLTNNRSLYDFVGEYYGDIDANIDFFINSNNLTGSEILELPKGRTVVVYG
jgi:hypothetical protein